MVAILLSRKVESKAATQPVRLMAGRSDNNSDELGSEQDPDSVGAHSTMPNESSAAAFLAGVKFARTQDAERQNRAASSGTKDMGGAEPEAESMEGGGVKARRTRQSFSWRQVAVLEQVFEQDPLPRQALRAQLAERLGVLPRTVQVWFQNRRQKQKQIQQAMGQSPPSFRSNVRMVALPHMDHGTCDAYSGPLANGLPLGVQYMQPSCMQPGMGMCGVVTAPMGAAAQYQVSAPHLYSSAFTQAPGQVSLQLPNTYLQQQVSTAQLRPANETASETVDDAAAAAPATVATATASVMKGAVAGAAGPPSGVTRGGAAMMMQMQLPVGSSRLQGGMPAGYPSMHHYPQLLPQHPQLNPQHVASVQAAQQAAIAAGGSFVPFDALASFNVCCGHEGGADTVAFKVVGHEGGAAYEPRDRLGTFVPDTTRSFVPGNLAAGPPAPPPGYVAVSNGQGLDPIFVPIASIVPVGSSQRMQPPTVSMVHQLAPGQPPSRPPPPTNFSPFP